MYNYLQSLKNICDINLKETNFSATLLIRYENDNYIFEANQIFEIIILACINKKAAKNNPSNHNLRKTDLTNEDICLFISSFFNDIEKKEIFDKINQSLLEKI